MLRISNGLIGILNILALIASIPIIGGGLWLRSHAASDCERVLLWPVLIAGLFLMVVSLLGILGSCCNVPCFLWAYLLVTFLMIIAVFCFTAFAVAVTKKGVGEAIWRTGGYVRHEDAPRIGDYSQWLQRRVADQQTWGRIKSCMIDARVCGGLHPSVLRQRVDNGLGVKSLSSVQSGCCKQPLQCELKKGNGMHLTAPKSALDDDDDCRAWSDDPSRLCFDCRSCKAGVLDDIKTRWRKLAAFNTILLVFLILVYSIGCCALRNSCRDNRYLKKVCQCLSFSLLSFQSTKDFWQSTQCCAPASDPKAVASSSPPGGHAKHPSFPRMHTD